MDILKDIILGLISFAGGVGAYKLVRTYLTLKGGQYDLNKSKRKDQVDEFKEIIDIQRRDIDEGKVEIKSLNDRVTAILEDLSQCETRNARQEAIIEYQGERIKSLEEALAAARINVRTPRQRGSDLHRPLPPDPQEEGTK